MNFTAIKSEPASANVTIPIVIGVTGHRDLRPEDILPLEHKVHAELSRLKADYPYTPLLVMSPLAEGADRLVARVALQQGARLVVPLPLPRTEYEKDFEHLDAAETAKSKQEFNELLNRATSCWELPLVEGNTSAGIAIYGVERDKQYAQVGADIARRGQILLALWDGDTSSKMLLGGTTQIVEFKLAGVSEDYGTPQGVLDTVDTGPVYHIATPRSKNSVPPKDPLSTKLLFPHEWGSVDQATASHRSMLKRVDTINRDATVLATALASEIRKNRSYVIPDDKIARLSARQCAILDRYAIVDTLAIHFQKRWRWSLIGLFLMAAVAVLSYEVYADLLPNPLVFALHPASLALAILLLYLATRNDYQNKYLDYRALAEGLRVQLFWDLSCLHEEVDHHYLRKQRTELEWIRNAIRACNLCAEHTCAPGVSNASNRSDEQCLAAIAELVRTHWVQDQKTFFLKGAQRDHLKLTQRELIVQRLLGITLILAVTVLGLHALLEETVFNTGRHWLIIALGMAPAIAAAISGYAEKMAFLPQSKRYEWMSGLFQRADNRIDALLRGRDLGKARELLRDLGKEALEENGDWVIMRRERTLEVMAGR